MINAAIVGLGRWGRILVDSVQGDSELIRFGAGVTRTPAKAEEFCSGHGMTLGADYDAMLADPAIDAVVLATPHTEHFNQIMAAARAGKHVFCEKPFSMTRADAATALDALAAAGLKAGVGHNRRFAPNTKEIKRAIEAGELGEMVHIEGQFSASLGRAAGTWRDSREQSPAGAMTSLGIHLLDAYIHLFGRIARVETHSKRVAIPIDIDDSTSIFLEFENGQTGYLGTLAVSAQMWRVCAFGDKGWAEGRDHNLLEKSLLDGTHAREEYPGYDYPAAATVHDELEAFARDITGDAPPAIPPDQILHCIAAFEAILKSADRGGFVDVE